jgi:hypothetical protein
VGRKREESKKGIIEGWIWSKYVIWMFGNITMRPLGKMYTNNKRKIWPGVIFPPEEWTQFSRGRSDWRKGHISLKPFIGCPYLPRGMCSPAFITFKGHTFYWYHVGTDSSPKFGGEPNIPTIANEWLRTQNLETITWVKSHLAYSLGLRSWQTIKLLSCSSSLKMWLMNRSFLVLWRPIYLCYLLVAVLLGFHW